ncbi:putative DNA-binding transcriptional regulator [Budviciaceae bacterium CWB-B4]|uniref:DNA-binding transcriptional regulator n=1 Tax=Limnobaculum xujianqingii TaxID=2738837 RepID=A0A9D7AIG8_9GAMM|nr:DNA-binding protein [Limnobaculum xujianqingii]MBK5073652.1 putative DNA-binding transcriptional regulator [Limnobaculum xujianqingii]MBK5176617.1 putative DNA-binding transcriptional regulator [Limnobaculum xujianqingii]
MKKEWFSTSELTGIAGLPSTIQGINQKARREQWKSRKRTGVQGKALEYHIDSIPDKVRIVLRSHEEGAKYSAMVNDPFAIWVTAYNQLTSTERERIISLIVRHGISGLMDKVNMFTVEPAEVEEVC